MPSTDLQKYLKNLNKKQFTNRTFEDFREELLQYANDFYRDQIVDFSEASLGGGSERVKGDAAGLGALGGQGEEAHGPRGADGETGGRAERQLARAATVMCGVGPRLARGRLSKNERLR